MSNTVARADIQADEVKVEQLVQMIAELVAATTRATIVTNQPGRGLATAYKREDAAVRKLFAYVAGYMPSQEQLDYMLR